MREHACDISEQSCSIRFICQGGDLEVMACLLAASLKRHWKHHCELVACVPEPSVSAISYPSDRTINLLKNMGVRVEYFRNHLLDVGRGTTHFLLTNKIYCLYPPTECSKIIFIDSDMLWRKAYIGEPVFSQSFGAICATFDSVQDAFAPGWEKIFRETEVPPVLTRLKVERGRFGDKDYRFIDAPPYFMSCFFYIHQSYAVVLADCWLDIFDRLENSRIMYQSPKVHYHQEQIGLSLSVYKLGVPYEIAPTERFHKYFTHYCANFDQLRRGVKLLFFISSLIREYPEIITIAREVSPEFYSFFRSIGLTAVKNLAGKAFSLFDNFPCRGSRS
jgi:hypothetical protein